MDDKVKKKKWKELTLFVKNDLKKDDVEQLAYLYEPEIPDCSEDDLMNAENLIDSLISNNLFTQANYKDFLKYLGGIGRKDLCIRIGKFMEDITKLSIQETNCYDMNREHHGKCIIFDNTSSGLEIQSDKPSFKKHVSTENDPERLNTLFKWLGYDVFYHSNVTFDYMETCLKESFVNTESDDSFVVVILSYGNRDGIFVSDNKLIGYDRIFDLCNSSNAPSLVGKPKLFFVSTCHKKGDFLQKSFDIEDVPEVIDGHAKADMFCILAHADESKCENGGTWFIQEFCDVFEKHAETKPLKDLRMKVARKFHDCEEKSNDSEDKPRIFVKTMLSTLQKTFVFGRVNQIQ